MRTHELPPARIVWAALAIAAVVLISVSGVLAWLRASDMPFGGNNLRRDMNLTVPGPALQSAPQPELQAYRADKARQLHGTAWVDAAHGIARIPIDDAMALMVQRAASASEVTR